MPKRTDIRKIMIIGSGPIVIGQACEFDYSGTQGCRALREEGYEVVLVNSNPATIMTDPEMASRTYVEPLTPEFVARIIQRERPQALLPTLGGQTALNLAVALGEDGTLDRFGVELIGAKIPAIRKAEDRELFKRAVEGIGLTLPRSGYARTIDEAKSIVRTTGYPAIIRPSFTLGGTGGSIAYNPEELEEAVRWGLQQSPAGTVLIEESVIGWKEFELEVMRDLADNVVIICSIENVDPMGVHTGDSVTVAPAQTLTDKEYQLMRDAAVAIIREIGVETGGSNIQFAVNPDDGRLVVIEMNPRVSRSSALASKATGFPIAKIAAKLAVGYRLAEVRRAGLTDAGVLRRAKQLGFADAWIARLTGTREGEIRARRLAQGIRATFKTVDTCAAEFAAYTPYLYSTYEEEDEAPPTDRRKVIILGSGPNRIGQGIEFDYCCVHAAFALRERGVEAIMINCNPETVSTDYDTSDRLYFEPLTLEDVLNVVEKERPFGVIVQFGGQTPLKLAVPLQQAGVPILGTSPDAIDRAEDRQRFSELIDELALNQAAGATVRSLPEARGVAQRLGYPVLVRPSYVLGGRAMRIVYDDQDLIQFVGEAVEVAPDHPILIDKFLEDSIEIDVDAVADAERVVVGGVMEHIEKAGVHSGDAACALPPYSLDEGQVKALRTQTKALAKALGVVGLINVQFAIRNETIFVLEVNPRASRTVPFVSKAIGVPLAKVATWAMLGESVGQLAPIEEREWRHIAVKESVFPFVKFPGVDIVLGPEMKSTGEVMGLDRDFRKAYLKSQIAAGSPLPTSGKVFVSVKNRDKRAVTTLARRLVEMGFTLVATSGTARVLERHGMTVEPVHKVLESHRPNVVDLMKRGEIALVFNTPEDGRARKDSAAIRRAAVSLNVPYYLTMDGAQAAIGAIEALLKGEHQVLSLQEYHADA